MQHPHPPATDGRNGAQRRNIVDGAEAARVLGLHRSTITRYLNTHPELNHAREPGRIALDLEEFRRHRDENVNRLMTGNHAGRLFDEARPPLRPAARDDTEDDDTAEAEPAGPQDQTVARLRARAELIKLNRLEREEAVELGALTPVAEVDQATGEALTKLRDALMSPDLDLCEKLAATTDAGEVATILRDANRAALTKLAEDFENDAERGDPA
ncbi:hypothetical protein [Parvibaculum sp.]|uniref:hypothetical protein n=1 Tax=Parvibaculum sp. TaxID=2024848 RepID=UPI001DB6ACCD|nr:hypothetical protein [Parvibaculum sp.]MBX3488880.1 hypothetical protein [Parvibaculum sp.]